MCTLIDLPTDLLRWWMGTLPLRDLISLLSTCGYFYRLSDEYLYRNYWRYQFRKIPFLLDESLSVEYGTYRLLIRKQIHRILPLREIFEYFITYRGNVRIHLIGEDLTLNISQSIGSRTGYPLIDLCVDILLNRQKLIKFYSEDIYRVKLRFHDRYDPKKKCGWTFSLIPTKVKNVIDHRCDEHR